MATTASCAEGRKADPKTIRPRQALDQHVVVDGIKRCRKIKQAEQRMISSINRLKILSNGTCDRPIDAREEVLPMTDNRSTGHWRPARVAWKETADSISVDNSRDLHRAASAS